MTTDIEFLKNLQAELNSQENDCQASPRFWVVGDYRWVECREENAERFSVYLPSAGGAYEVNYYLESVKEDEELSGEELEEFEEIGCESSALDWIQKYQDEDASLCPERKEHFVRENTMFLTKSEAKRHIELNHYHYTEEVHTYAMTAWRSPVVERLLKVLHEFVFDSLGEAVVKYQCESCGRKFQVEEDLEEPACNQCHGTNCLEIGIELVKAD